MYSKPPGLEAALQKEKPREEGQVGCAAFSSPTIAHTLAQGG
jgi:hypothetical protein